MVKVRIEFSELYNKPFVVDVKGLRSGVEWLTREIERALCFSCDGRLTVDWGNVDIPNDLRKKVILIQAM